MDMCGESQEKEIGRKRAELTEAEVNLHNVTRSGPDYLSYLPYNNQTTSV